jgi:hypothetical protein
MNEREFFELVKKMRLAQIRYFRTRDRMDLDVARDLERAVDEVIGGEQHELFPKGGAS